MTAIRWPFIARPDFLENGDTLRDAVAFVAAAWPTRSREERTRFEPMALDESVFASAPHTNKFGKPYPASAYKQQ